MISPSTPPVEANEEIVALIESLFATEQRLEELTHGEVDSIAGRDGRTFLLRRAQDQLRLGEAAKRAAIAATVQQQHTELRVLFDLMPAMLWYKDTENRILRVNQRVAEAAGKFVEEIEGKPSAEIYPQDAARFYADDLEVIRSGVSKLGFVETLFDPEGRQRWVQTDKVPVRDEHGRVTGIFVVARDITDRKRAEAQLEEVHKQLVETSRQAGQAEVATNVLHNVGNVLNSVNVSATLVIERVRSSKAANLARLGGILREHATDLVQFLTTDPRGRTIPDYVVMLAADLAAERLAICAELGDLRKNIEHIKDIVAMQQTYAKVSGVTESVAISELADDALRMNAEGLARRRIKVVREYQTEAILTVERSKVMQIFVNLIRNAKLACDESRRADGQIKVRISRIEDAISIAVIDNGVGIPSENLTRIFAHGFTTRKNGHGFGLHSAALAAKEMGGVLRAESAGSSQGATFTLELPANAKAP